MKIIVGVTGAQTIEVQIDHIIGKILLQFGIAYDKFIPWQGESEAEQ